MGLGTLNAVTNTIMLVVNASIALALAVAAGFYGRFREAARWPVETLHIPPEADLLPSRRTLLVASALFATNAYLYSHSAYCNMHYTP